jgi:thiol:disulfide interchange protein DsbC
MKTYLKLVAAAALIATSAAATAGPKAVDTSDIIKKVTPLLNGLAVEKIVPTDHAGLYEILTQQGLFYTDKAGSFVIFNGTMVDTKTKANLTDRRLEELIGHRFEDFPLQDAIKTVRGNGSRVMVTFEDPNCGFCKKLMQEAAKLDNVTTYTFLIPILGPDSAVKAKAIWCSSNPSKTWNDFMGSNTPLPTTVSANCEVPFERNLALQRKLHVNGTPAMYFKNNATAKGYITASEIEAKLN